MAEATTANRIGNYRWRICALLFFATTINYIDRQVLGILAPELQRVFGWNEVSYSNIVVAFQAAYAIGLLGVGRLLDVIGTRLGFLFALILWSIAAMGHALARSVFGFGTARFFLGLGESGNFPASIKTVAEWFPRKERALATGIFNAGSNVGAIIAPLTVPFIAIHYGWRWAFILTGAIGFLWIIFWMSTYRPPQEHPRLSAAEKAYIEQDPPEPTAPIPWKQLFPHRQLWAIFIGKFLTDPIWWFYLYWIPKFLNQKHGLTLSKIGLPLVVIYLTADVGSIAGGWISSTLIKRGWTVNAGRKTAMLLCAIAVVPIIFASQVSNVWVAVALISLAASAHAGWSANIFTLVSDVFPKQAVGSAVGFVGMGGAVGGMLIATFVGHLLQWTGSYLWPFVIAGSAYLTALLIIHLILPNLAPAKFGQD